MPDTASLALNRIAFLSAIFSTVAWVIYILTASGSPPLPSISDPLERLAALDAAKGVRLWYGWAGTFGALLTIPYLFGIVHSMPERGSQRWIAFIAGTLGATLTAVSFMIVSLAPVYFVLPVLMENPGLAESYLVALEVSQRSIEVSWFFGSFLAYSFAVTWIASDALRSSIGPNWLNWVGIIGGITGIIWLRPFLDFLLPLTTVGSIANIVLLSVWATGLTFVLWRHAD